MTQGDTMEALATFLDCLVALQECQYTSKLLPTLHQLASVYLAQGEIEKAEEISELCSLLQDVVTGASERSTSVKKSRRTVMEFTDYGKLFLQKAKHLEDLTRHLVKTGDVQQAIEHAQNVFRVHQYVLGLKSSTTEGSLRDLILLYTKAGYKVHCVRDSETIVFTSEILSPRSGTSNEHMAERSLHIPDTVSSAHHCTDAMASSQLEDVDSHSDPGTIAQKSMKCLTNIFSVRAGAHKNCSYCSLAFLLGVTTIAALVVLFE